MTATRAGIGSVVFLVVVPGTVAGLVPWLIGGWRLHRWAGAPITLPLGAVVCLVGLGFLVHAFAAFATRGLGTPAPIAPPQHLVVTGAYRHVRNPMYLAVLAVILGQALVFGDVPIALYGALVFVLFAGFVQLYEEPTLRKLFGQEYQRYTDGVPRWIPRIRGVDSEP